MIGKYQNGKSSMSRSAHRATATAPAKAGAKPSAKPGAAKSGAAKASASAKPGAANPGAKASAPAKSGQAAVVVAKVDGRAFDQFAAAAKLRGETPSQAIANFIARKPGKVPPRGDGAAPARRPSR